MAKRDESLLNIRHQLSVLEVEARLNNKVNRQGVNLSAEDILGGLLNLLRDWNLRNANADGQNFPAIDLADWDEGVVVQVSSDTSASKIRETLEKLKNPEFADKEINRLVMMFLKPKLKYTTVFEHDGFELEILDFDDLSSAVEHKSYAKLQEISAYLDEEVGKLTGTVNPKPAHLLPPVPLPSASFVEGSRDRELEELKEKLSPDAPVFLYGVGGIGKTELTIQLAKRFAPPEGAYFLHYYDTEGEALRETILRANFTGYSYQKADTENRDHEYKERMDILRTEYPGALLIIDNFDCTGRTIAQLQAEPAYRELTAMGIRLVFTTRSRVRGGYEIEPLRPEHLLKLMRDNLDGGDVSDAELRQLIEAVDGHTLMAVLMARTLAESWGGVTAENILNALRSSDLNRADFPEVVSDQNQSYEQKQIYTHLKALFDLTRLNEADRAVLRCATLLPEDGMDVLTFKNCLDEKTRSKPVRFYQKLFGKKSERIPSEQEAFVYLTKTGWLAVDADRKLLSIHPVIREVCWEALEPTDENCIAFMYRLWKRFDLNTEFHAERFTQIAGCFSMASDKLADGEGWFALRAGQFWRVLGQDQNALRYELRMLERRKKMEDADPGALAAAYSNVSLTYDALGDRSKALQFQLKALEISEKVLSPDDPDLAKSYDNLGYVYGGLGDYGKALEWQLKALGVFEKVLPEDHPDLATCYNNIAFSFYQLGQYDRAMEYRRKDMEICEKILSPDHPKLALSHDNWGMIYDDMGDHRKALEHKLKAMEIRENVLPPKHPARANSYNNVGYTFGALGDHSKALEYHLKALEATEGLLPPDHPDVAVIYSNIGVCYIGLEQYDHALEYLEKSLEIFKRSLPAGHLSIAANERGIEYVRTRM